MHADYKAKFTQQNQPISIDPQQPICHAGILVPGCTETDIDKQLFDLAAADFGTRKHWHQRLPRVGQNTIHPIYDKVADRALQEDDIVYVDLGPVFGDMEADFGRTYVLGEPKRTSFPLCIT